MFDLPATATVETPKVEVISPQFRLTSPSGQKLVYKIEFKAAEGRFPPAQFVRFERDGKWLYLGKMNLSAWQVETTKRSVFPSDSVIFKAFNWFLSQTKAKTVPQGYRFECATMEGNWIDMTF